MVPPLQYERIKHHIREGIQSGEWVAGARIPSENELAKEFSASRMTANRAINELTAEGLLERIQGKGTFVAANQSLRSVLRIQGIDQEVRSRGNQYSSRLLHLSSTASDRHLASLFGLPIGAKLFFSRIVHLEESIPIQLEERWVNPKVAPCYADQDFEKLTPHDYLMSVAPLTRGVHTIEACLPDSRISRALKMEKGLPCLLIYRQTWVNQTVASYAKLYHPGNRYQLRADWN